MKLLLKPMEDVDAYKLAINRAMFRKFGKVIDVCKVGIDNMCYYVDADGWCYMKEWFVTDHELLKELKKHL